MSMLGIFVALSGALLLIASTIFRIELRYATAQGINLDYSVAVIQFMGWLGIVVLIVGIVLIMADRRRRREVRNQR